MALIVCPECGRDRVSSTAVACPECGFNNSEIVCECGNKLVPGTKFCPECGKKVQ